MLMKNIAAMMISITILNNRIKAHTSKKLKSLHKLKKGIQNKRKEAKIW